MGSKTNIAWTSSTVNTAYGCKKVSAGCDHCYMYRYFQGRGENPEYIRVKPASKIIYEIKKAGKYIFVNSLSDTFLNDFSYQQIDEWMDIFGKFPDKFFQVLTKRTNRMYAYVRYRIATGKGIPYNVWLGTSVEDRWHAFRIKTMQRIRKALPRHVLFISFEPLLGAMPDDLDLTGISWAIVGGESGYPPKFTPRPMSPGWAEHIRVLCGKFKVAFFFKQAGGVGTDGAGGNTLFGKVYQELPLQAAEEALIASGNKMDSFV